MSIGNSQFDELITGIKKVVICRLYVAVTIMIYLLQDYCNEKALVETRADQN